MEKATNEERQRLKDRVVEAVKGPWLASDAGEVLLSIGTAMMKAAGVTEAEYLEYCRKNWLLQTPKNSAQN